jgi:hypothetical protein
MSNLVPLNTFKTATANVTTQDTLVYQTPLGTATVVLLAQFANMNTAGQTVNVSANIYRAGQNTEVIKDFAIPVGDAASILTGRLVLEEGNRLYCRANGNNMVKLTFSYLETATA